MSKDMNIGKPLTYWNKDLVLATALKYKTKTDFFNNASGAYSYARSHGFLDEACRHMVTPKIKHTKKAPLTHAKVFAIAKKYNRRVDFQKNDNRAWRYSVKHGLKERACAHMMSKKESVSYATTYWTLDKVIKIAKKCQKWSVLSKKYPRLVDVIREHRWKNDVLSHLIYDGKGKWALYSDKELTSIIKKYKTYESFKKKESSLYTYLINNKKKNLLFNNLKYKRCHRQKWSKQMIIDVSLRYDNLTDFIKKEPNAYYWACKLKIIGSLNHLVKRKYFIKWTREAVVLEAKKYTYRREFMDNSGSAYKAAKRFKIVNEVCAHMEWRGHKKITKEMVLEKAKEFKRRIDFSRKAEPYYRRACQGKYLDEACAHMMSKAEALRINTVKWTREKLFEEAKKYKNSYEMSKKQSGAVDAAYRMGIIHLIFANHPKKEKKWTYENCKKEVKKYKNRQELVLKQEGCIQAIYKNKWYDLIEPLKKRHPYFVERKILHPKIDKILKKYNLSYSYEPKFVKSNFPDFIFYFDNKIFIIEAKSEYGTDHQCQLTDNQVQKQIKSFTYYFKEKKIIHILISENGYIFCNHSNYCLSLNQLHSFIKCLLNHNEFNHSIANHNSLYKDIKKSALAIEKEYLKKYGK